MLFVMVVQWICASITMMEINLYLQYVPGGIFLNFTIAGFAEIFANVAAGVAFTKLGTRWAFMIGYIFAIAGGICLIWQDKFVGEPLLIAAFVLLAKFGASMVMCMCYISTPWMFPVTICGTAFGICNLFGRFTQASSPILAGLAIPLPMQIFSAISVAGLVGSLFVKP